MLVCEGLDNFIYYCSGVECVQLSMYQESGSKRRRRTSSRSSISSTSSSLCVVGNMAEDSDDAPMPGVRVDENPEHGMKVLRSLCFLKKEKVLCDVTLIAEGELANLDLLGMNALGQSKVVDIQ